MVYIIPDYVYFIIIRNLYITNNYCSYHNLYKLVIFNWKMPDASIEFRRKVGLPTHASACGVGERGGCVVSRCGPCLRQMVLSHRNKVYSEFHFLYIIWKHYWWKHFWLTYYLTEILAKLEFRDCFGKFGIFTCCVFGGKFGGSFLLTFSWIGFKSKIVFLSKSMVLNCDSLNLTDERLNLNKNILISSKFYVV